MDESERSPHEPDEETREAHRRVLLPLLIPAAGFLFAVLAIYGLSRIYLDLADFEVGEVNMATPLAIGVALGILGTAWYLATHPGVSRMQIASIITVAVALLLAGSIWAAVHEEEGAVAVMGPGETPPAGETPGPPGAIQVELTDPDPYTVNVQPASAQADGVTFNVSNTGELFHNFRAIKTDLPPDGLPVEGAQVNEDEVEVVATIPDFEPGVTQEVTEPLEAGSYVLICNVAGHYELGMHAAFTVE